MKNSKIMLSVIMVVILIFVSVTPAFAVVAPEDSVSGILQWQNKIDEVVLNKMNESSTNEKIPVVVWYKDISQTKIDAQVKEKTGLTVNSLSEDLTMPDTSLLNDIKNNEMTAEKRMHEYLEKTKPIRDKEREKTENFVQERRKLSRQAYTEESELILDIATISDSEIIFNSRYAPMIICELTVSQIKELEKDTRIESISYYEEPVNQECVVTNVENVKPITRQNDIENILDLTGDGIKVGMVEGGYAGVDEELPEGSVINIGNVPVHWHATGTAKVLKGTVNGFAKDIELYSTNGDYSNIELLLTQGVDIINVSWDFHCIFESNNSSLYAYSNIDKWYDHLVSHHNVTVVASAGNAGDGSIHPDYPNEIQYRIASPAMGNNVIAVGAYKVYSSGNFLNSSSSYKNTNGTSVTQGIEKPDVVMPANSYIDNGGTSYAAPVLTAMIAQVLELKPSLAAFPQAIKAIVLASCHRKVIQSETMGGPETMGEGITERQGAGAPDAWTMASIICQGSYGIGVLNDSSTNINFVQPPYGAENMNVSVAWIKENTHANTSNLECGTTNDVVSAPSYNLDLQVVSSVGTAKSSTLPYSSTEMCYLPLSSTDFRYQIRLTNNTSTTASVRYGYAWSTDNMRAAPLSDKGVYYIKNVDSGKYITYTETNGTAQVTLSEISTTSVDNSVYQWVIEGLNFIPGCETEKLYLAQGTTAVGTSRLASLDDEEQEWYPLYNDDGTVSYVNASFNRILSYNGDNVVWDRFSLTSTPTSAQKWYLEKNSYIVADANADGAFSEAEDSVNLDARFIQQCLSGVRTATNVQAFLSDANRDGVVDIFDATRVQEICEGYVIY